MNKELIILRTNDRFVIVKLKGRVYEINDIEPAVSFDEISLNIKSQYLTSKEEMK